MNTNEKNAALSEWQRRWDLFIQNAYDDYKTRHNLV